MSPDQTVKVPAIVDRDGPVGSLAWPLSGGERSAGLPDDYESYIGKAYYYDAPICPAIEIAVRIAASSGFIIMRDTGTGIAKWLEKGD